MRESAIKVGAVFILGIQALLTLVVFIDVLDSPEPLWMRVLVTMVVNFLNQQTFRFLKGTEE